MIDAKRFKAARKAAGFTQVTLAEAAGVSSALVKKIEQGQRDKSLKIVELAAALKVSVEYLHGQTENKKPTMSHTPELVPVSGKLLRVVGMVEAGTWREATQFADGERPEYPVAENPAFLGFDQFLLAVAGESMNVVYPPGTLLHCVRLAFQPRNLPIGDGDHLIVQRERHGLYETTVKELEGGKLWPRSHDPRFVEPVAVGEHEGDRVEVVALVIGSYFPRPGVAHR